MVLFPILGFSQTSTLSPTFSVVILSSFFTYFICSHLIFQSDSSVVSELLFVVSDAAKKTSCSVHYSVIPRIQSSVLLYLVSAGSLCLLSCGSREEVM